MAKLIPKKQFWAALEAARQPSHSGLHPFSAAWAAGDLTREQLGEWAVQHYYYIRPVPQHFALLYSRLPDLDARQHLLENMLGEEMPEQPEKRHPDLLVKFGMACGKSRNYIVDGEDENRILPTTRAMAAGGYYARHGSLDVGTDGYPPRFGSLRGHYGRPGRSVAHSISPVCRGAGKYGFLR